MKKSNITCSLAALLVLIVSSGCAKYQPGVLANLQPEFAAFSETKSGITLSVKKLNSGDSKRILNRDVIKKGYQPIQITINNDTKKYILFSNQGVSLPTVPAQEVADKVHTSTVGRAATYGVAGLFVWPLLIPAVVDGVGSAQANEQLDRDYNAKVMDQMVIQPYGNHNGLIFVPVSEFQDSFEVILVDRETKEKISYRVTGF
jgi:hypothetical protein